MKALLAIAACALALAACDYNYIKDKGAKGGGRPIDQKDLSAPDFNVVMATVIGPKCLSCHSEKTGNQGGTNLETYGAVVGKLNRVEFRSLEKLDMPPRSPLNGDEQRILRTWSDNGAPEKTAGGGEKPGGDLLNGPNDWKKISERVLGPKCTTCHQQPNPDGGLDMSDRAQVVAKAKEIWNRIVVTRDMPVPPLTGLTKTEKEVLFDWMDAGFPQ